MAQKLTAAIPADLDLPANFIVQLSAVDPSTGALVSGINVSGVAIIAQPAIPGTADEAPSLVPVQPLWLPEELTAQGNGGG
jgi:hypothetical protein